MHVRTWRQWLGASVSAAALVCIAATTLAAQTTGIVRGRITDAGTGQPIADAQVGVFGLQLGAMTNQDGQYTVGNIPAGAQVVTVRRIGYRPARLPVTITPGEPTTLNLTLSISATQLDQVIVTGTGGNAERKTLGNSITKLDVSEMTSRNTIMNVSEVLQSKSPGVSILPGSGAPGTAGEIRIRGSSSLSGYKPVVFIDGIRFSIEDVGGFSATGGGTAGLAQSTQVTSALNNLNPNDIESIEIIKGPAAATLYGAEAANGVIQIITKKGTRGQQAMRWGVKTEQGTSVYNLMPEDNYTTCDATKQALRVSVTDTSFVWPGCQGLPVNTVISGNPMRDDPRATRDGGISRLSVDVRGGGDRYSFYLAGARDTEQGTFRNSDNANTSIRTNFGFTPSSKSEVQITLNWQSGRLRLPMQDESANGLLLSARRGLPGRASLLGVGNEGWRTISPTAANRYRNYTSTERLTIGSTINFNPIPWFQNRLTVGFDNTLSQAQLLFLPGDIDVSQDPDAASGANYRRTPTRKVLTLDYAGTMLYNWRTDWLMTTRFGSQVVSDKTETLSAFGIGIGAPDVTLVNLLQRSTGAEAFGENNSVGYYLQEQVGWKDRLYLIAALRADDHSSFGKNFDMIVYPKLSAAYVVSEQPGAKKLLQAARVTSLKLRTAWGMAGRAPSAYSAPQTYTVDRVTLGTTTGSALRTSAFGNPDLKPEKGTELELGFEAGLLDERMGIDFTYYSKKTSDMLQSVSIPASTGFISSQLTNLGEVTNKGIELSLYGTPWMARNVSWDTRLSVATNKNELQTFGIAGKLLDTPSGQAYGSVQQHRPGYPLGGFWVTPPLRDANGVALLTTAGAAQFPTGDTARRYIGPSVPTIEMGLSNSLTLFRWVKMYVLLDYKAGNYVFNLQERNRCQSQDNCSRNNDPRARFPQTAADSVLFKELAVYRSSSVSPEWIQPGDFLKLREVSMSVEVPTQWTKLIGAQQATFTLSGRNLGVLWTKYEGVDPEVNSYGGRNFVRVDAYALPMMRRFTASINLQY